MDWRLRSFSQENDDYLDYSNSFIKIASIYGKAHKNFSKHAIESSRNGAPEMEVTKSEF